MNCENKTVTQVTENSCPVLIKSQISLEQLRGDYEYCMAQKMIKILLNNGLISMDEFNKISKINRQTFSPYLSEIM